MKRVPPWIVRRLLLTPAVLLLDLAIVVLSPVLAVLALIVSPLFGGWRPLRMTLVVVVFAARHLQAGLALLILWLRAGLGRRLDAPDIQAAHVAVMRRFVASVFRAVVRLARVEVRIDESSSAHHALTAHERPVVVLSRHAGEGDTLLVIHELLCRHDRGPRIVMHEALQLDPVIDVLGNRLPHRFVDPRGGDTEQEITALAEHLDDRAALVIFPEGANFSSRRRQRAIRRLEERGHAREADAARAMRHVSAPRPGGALAAIEANPTADVIVLGHVGCPNGLGEVWDLLPHPQAVDLKLWHEPAGAIPAGHDERIAWLFERWRVLDDWVEERRGPQDARSPAPRS